LAQAIGRSRGGRTTKIHAVVDCLGRLIAFEITPGQLGDVRVAGSLLAPMPAARLCIADTAYDSNGLRQFLSERGTQPVIPNNPTRKRFHPFDADIYKQRNLIERMFCRLKDWRRIAGLATTLRPCGILINLTQRFAAMMIALGQRCVREGPRSRPRPHRACLCATAASSAYAWTAIPTSCSFSPGASKHRNTRVKRRIPTASSALHDAGASTSAKAAAPGRDRLRWT
jgi:transposase